jgi:Zn-dependent M28 family amino/carboxypeptidase
MTHEALEEQMKTRSARRLVVVFTVILALLVSMVPVAVAAPKVDSSALREAVTVEGIMTHLEAFQAIADDNDDTRASGTDGYLESVAYVQEQLEAAGYDVTVQPFTFEYEEVLQLEFAQVAPTAGTYEPGVDYLVGFGSANGDETAPVQAVDINLAGDRASTSGCEADDFAGFMEGNIALIQRGSCNFTVKVENAEAVGAAGVIIFNQGNVDPADDRFGLFSPNVVGADIPVVAVPFALGAELAATPGLVVRLDIDVFRQERISYNVLADTPAGRDDRVVVVGAHLDSVLEGPGINDNGSGVATILEIAMQIAELGIEPVNTVRFAFWGAEESGLVGAQHYVDQLSKRQIKDIAVNLNFDMVGSPNFGRFVYDGDGSATGTAGPNGSGVAEGVFADYFRSEGLAFEPTAFDGRSDYGPFIAVGIPASGLFTGAEDIKTADQVALYGGTAGVAFDPCYHAACDDIDNLSEQALDEMSDAAAHAVYTFAMTTSAVNGTDKGKANGLQAKLEYWGPLAQR